MSPQTLKDFLKQQPFKPFRIVQSDGTGYDVRHPDMLMVGLREAIVGLPAKSDPTMFDRFVTLDFAPCPSCGPAIRKK